MARHSLDWQAKGVAAAPEYTVAAAAGLLLYRCWGDKSSDPGHA